jgi:hypothetical protein
LRRPSFPELQLNLVKSPCPAEVAVGKLRRFRQKTWKKYPSPEVRPNTQLRLGPVGLADIRYQLDLPCTRDLVPCLERRKLECYASGQKED